MLKNVLAPLGLLLALPSFAVAQRPPALNGPAAWVIHNEAGPMVYEIVIAGWYPDFALGMIVYLTDTIDTTTGKVVGHGINYVPMEGDGTTTYSWSDDSGLWSRWVWAGDHYNKVGGSPAVRSYWPRR